MYREQEAALLEPLSCTAGNGSWVRHTCESLPVVRICMAEYSADTVNAKTS
jgi:hypothetical protein